MKNSICSFLFLLFLTQSALSREFQDFGYTYPEGYTYNESWYMIKIQNCLPELEKIAKTFKAKYPKNNSLEPLRTSKEELDELIQRVWLDNTKLKHCEEHVNYVSFLYYYEDSNAACKCELYARKVYHHINSIKTKEGHDTE